MKAAIVGVTGYTGVELIRLIQQHPKLTIGTIHSHTMHEHAEKVYPHLNGFLDQEILPYDPQLIQQENDLVFFATPAGISKTLAADFVEKKFPIIDLSGDLRLKKPSDYQRYYQKEPAEAALLAQAEYVVPEFNTAQGNLIANPGCYATAAILASAPIVQQGWLAGTMIFDGKSGLSGAGKSLTDSSHYVSGSENMTMYKVNQHQHIPEILQQLQQWDPDLQHIHFSTSLIPVKRGIFMTLYAPIKETVTEAMLYQQFLETYEKAAFVRVQPLGKMPALRQVTATNFCDIGLSMNQETQILTVAAVIDNLGKGAAGQAIQNFNVWAGLPETAGLLQVPIYP